VTVASVSDTLQITASRGTRIVADRRITEGVDETYDLIALPGGIPGAENLRDSKELEDMLKRQQREGLLYGAICASPATSCGELQFALKLVEMLYSREKADEVALPMVVA
jgi:4-methyl-5(b-hydroxyethyl)-thiazole monophosphate biosynthesis